jgi:hypothetical protein
MTVLMTACWAALLLHASFDPIHVARAMPFVPGTHRVGTFRPAARAAPENAEIQKGPFIQ